MFIYQRKVAFCDTDAMGVVHHATYLCYFEEARVAWLEKKNMSQWHYPEQPMVMAVLETSCKHYQPLRFNDVFSVYTQMRLERLKIYFQYVIYNQQKIKVVDGHSLHVPVNEDLKICRLPEAMTQLMEKELWTEI